VDAALIGRNLDFYDSIIGVDGGTLAGDGSVQYAKFVRSSMKNQQHASNTSYQIYVLCCSHTPFIDAIIIIDQNDDNTCMQRE
jgi:hypothetical protein